MRYTVYIGLDDTDNARTPGDTLQLGTRLAAHLESLGFGHQLGATRHQLLLDKRILYTSDNHATCITMITSAPVGAFVVPCVEYVQKYADEDSNPGLCIFTEHSFSQRLFNYGSTAVYNFIFKDDALALMDESGLFIRELGGNGNGIIGALAAVSLNSMTLQ